MSFDKIVSSALNTIETEIKALENLKSSLDNNYKQIVKRLANCKGRLVFTGIGKSAIIAQKTVATLNSTGTAALFMHAADAIHGDLGMVQKKDIVVLLSNSGETPEIKVLLPIIKNAGNTSIAFTGNRDSFLANNSDYFILVTVPKEACPNNLAPTASTTAQLALGDAIAMSLLSINNFKSSDFAKFHPGGSLGKRLYLKVADVCKNNTSPFVKADSSIEETILEITTKRLGATIVVNEKKEIVGIVTDGDLRRMIENKKDYHQLSASDIMGRSPFTIEKDCLAVDALSLLRQKKISHLIVTDKGKYYNILHFHDLIREGLV